jgi:hypothetical protein
VPGAKSVEWLRWLELNTPARALSSPPENNSCIKLMNGTIFSSLMHELSWPECAP